MHKESWRFYLQDYKAKVSSLINLKLIFFSAFTAVVQGNWIELFILLSGQSYVSHRKRKSELGKYHMVKIFKCNWVYFKK